jgi:hypothetical protein
MKSIYLIALGLSLLAVKCNRKDWNVTKNTVMDLKGFIKNHKKSFKLGDTLVFEITLPDTAIIKNLKDNTVQEVIAQKYEFIQACFFVTKLDTVNKKYFNRGYNDVETFFNDKKNPNVDYGCAEFINKDVKILILPKLRGIYYLETPKVMNSNFRINSTLDGVSRLLISNLDKNLEILMPYISEFINSSTRTTDIYAFKVE